MSLFNGKLAAGVTTVLTGLGSTFSTAFGSVASGVTGILNTNAGQAAVTGAASYFGGKDTGGSVQATLLGLKDSKSEQDMESGDGSTTPLKGIKKFFCYYLLKDGMYVMKDGKKQVDYMKIIGHASIVVAIITFIMYGRKKRWF